MFPCQSLGWCHKVVPKYNFWWQTFVGSKTLVPHKCAYGSRPTPPPIRWKFCACACTLDTRRLTNTLKPRYNNNPPCLIWPASQIYRLTELGYLLWTSEKCTMMCSNLIFLMLCCHGHCHGQDMEHRLVWPFWIEVARACLAVSLSWTAGWFTPSSSAF